MSELQLTIEAIDFHRNGVTGEGFHVVLFTDVEYGPFVGIVFDEPGHVAVLQQEKLSKHVIGSFENAWRGDHFEPILRKAIAEYQQSLFGVERS